MFKAQNNQLHSHIPKLFTHNILKFCYFTMPLFLLSCGDVKTSKAPENIESTKQTQDSLTTTNSNKTILCFGDSITAGYGLNDSTDAYPAILQQKVDSLKLNYTVINSGVSGETTAGGKSRINWVIKQPVDIFLLELGANDGLRGVPLSETRSNLQTIIDVVREKSPKTIIILAGMELPPNMGQAYTSEFRQLFADLAQKNNLAFIPFILKDVGGIASLNQNDGIHPTVEGHKIVAKTVWHTLEPLLKL
ncbi:MAG: arylesterase [Xanthomarina sp.]